MLISPSSGPQEDLVYQNHEINRSMVGVAGDFRGFGEGGLIGAAVSRAKKHGEVRILDAGCGTGRGLIDLKDQVNFQARIPENLIEAIGISLTDLTSRFEGGWREKKCLKNGYVTMRVGNLATAELQPSHFDLAYAYQVLLHNQTITPIIKNILPSLRPGGVFYCDTLPEQEQERQNLSTSLNPEQWSVRELEVTKVQRGAPETRIMSQFTRIK